MKRFVVLTHDHPTLHWDLMLENGIDAPGAGAGARDAARLRTWRLAKPPDSGGIIDAVALPDHRTTYLEYEGPVSGERGEVRRWDRGEYLTIESTSVRVIVRLAGEQLHGVATLVHGTAESAWVFQFAPAPDP